MAILIPFIDSAAPSHSVLLRYKPSLGAPITYRFVEASRFPTLDGPWNHGQVSMRFSIKQTPKSGSDTNLEWRETSFHSSGVSFGSGFKKDAHTVVSVSPTGHEINNLGILVIGGPGIGNAMQSLAFLEELPEREVHVGSRWDIQTAVPAVAVFPVHFSLNSLKVVKGHTLASIQGQGTTYPGVGTGYPEHVDRSAKISLAVDIVFDNTAGRIVSMQRTLKSKPTSETPSKNYPAGEVRSELTLNR